MANPEVSVVIPAYNHERYIAETLESVLNQTFSDFEVVVIDDGSADGTGDVVKSFKDKRISYAWQENRDAFNTINRGLRESRGRYLAILNSDDVYHPERLERLLAVCGEKKAEFAFTDVQAIDAASNKIADPNAPWNRWHEANRSLYFEKKDLLTGFLNGNFMVTTSNVFMTRRAYQKIGEFASIRYLHDYDYIMRAIIAFPETVAYLADEKLVSYRVHSGNTLLENGIAAREQDVALIRRYMNADIPGPVRQRIDVANARLCKLEEELKIERGKLKQQSGGILSRIRRLIKL